MVGGMLSVPQLAYCRPPMQAPEREQTLRELLRSSFPALPGKWGSRGPQPLWGEGFLPREVLECFGPILSGSPVANTHPGQEVGEDNLNLGRKAFQPVHRPFQKLAQPVLLPAQEAVS
ncbi:Elongator Complex Protein 1 [Manis pentadactyla]|nr:Elongator Complex Protein 1 [Manis pentadactyla]